MRIFYSFYYRLAMREKCPNTDFFPVRIFRIRTEYGEIWSISPYSIRMRKNTDQKKLRIWTRFMQCSVIDRLSNFMSFYGY